MYGDINKADTVIATTIKAAPPQRADGPDGRIRPGTSNLSGTSNTWGEPALERADEDAGMGVTIDGYHIQVSTDGGTTWTDVEDDTEDELTYYTHDTEPAADEVRMYRVAAHRR